MLSKIVPKFFEIKNLAKLLSAHVHHQRNNQFYQDLLQNHEMDDTIQVTEKSIKTACPPHVSFYYEVSQIEIFGTHQNGKEYKKSLLIKELPMKEATELYRTNVALGNEVAAYNQIFPYLRSSRIELPIPNCLYATPDVIILEDMLTEGYELVDKSIKGLTLEQCELVVQALAKIHAASIVFQKKNGKEFKSISSPSREILYHETESKIFEHQTKFLDNLMGSIKQQPFSVDNNKIIQVVKDLKDNSRAKVKKLLLEAKNHSVICHGSLLSTNIYFKNNQVLLSDLSQIRYNSPASDLNYLLYVNLEPKSRVENMRKILEVYLKVLHFYTADKQVDVGSVFTNEWLDQEMKRFAIYGLTYGLWTIPIFYSKAELKNTVKFQFQNQTMENIENLGEEYVERAKNLVLSYIDMS